MQVNNLLKVNTLGFEPATYRSRNRCANHSVTASHELPVIEVLACSRDSHVQIMQPVAHTASLGFIVISMGALEVKRLLEVSYKCYFIL